MGFSRQMRICRPVSSQTTSSGACEFDHELVGYVRGHRERWDITAVLEPIQLLGARTGQVRVHLHRSPLGNLVVTLQFELQPVACGRQAG